MDFYTRNYVDMWEPKQKCDPITFVYKGMQFLGAFSVEMSKG